MMEDEAGAFYELRMRLRGKLSTHCTRTGKAFTPSQEEAWMLLNEVDQVIQLIARVSKYLPPNLHRELRYDLQLTLVKHQPKWKYRGPEGSVNPPELGEFFRFLG